MVEDGSMALGLPQYYTLHPHVRPDRRWCKCQLLWKKRWRPRENLKSAGSMPNSDALSMATFNALDAGAQAVLTFIEYHRSIIEYIGVLNTCTTPTSIHSIACDVLHHVWMFGFGGVPWGPGQRRWTTAAGWKPEGFGRNWWLGLCTAVLHERLHRDYPLVN